MTGVAIGPVEWLQALQSEPLAWEVAILLALFGLLALVRAWMLRRLRGVLRHGDLEDLLLGYEAVLSDRPVEVDLHFSRALEAEPADSVVRELLSRARLRLVSNGDGPLDVDFVTGEPIALDRSTLSDSRRFAAFLARAVEFRAPLSSWQRVRDALEANRQHIIELIDEALQGDDSAAQEIAEIGEMAAVELLRRVVRAASPSRELDALTHLARQLGPAGLPAFFTALREKEVAVDGDRSRALSFVRDFAERIGLAAARATAAAASSEDAAIRRIAIQVAMVSGSAEFFDLVCTPLPRAEVLRARGKVSPTAFGSTLASLGASHWLWQHLLQHPDPGAIAAFARASQVRPLEEPTRALLESPFAMQSLGIDALDLVTRGVVRLETLSQKSRLLLLEPLILRATDPECDDPARQSAVRQILGFGSSAVVPLLAMIGERPAPLDGEIEVLLRQLGRAAVAGAREIFLGVAASGTLPVPARALRRLFDVLGSMGGIGAGRLLTEIRGDARAPILAQWAREALERTTDTGGTDAKL